MGSPLDVITIAWKDSVGLHLDFARLFDGIISDCGVDALSLTSRELHDSILFEQKAEWHKIAFASAACLAVYSSSPLESNEHFVRAIAAMALLSQAIWHGFGDWEFTFDICLKILVENLERCSHLTRMEVLAMICAECHK